MRLISGRFFSPSDNQVDAARVTILNEALAAQLFPGQEAVGQQVEASGAIWEVVGVVSNVRTRTMNEVIDRRIYCPNAFNGVSTINVVLRTKLAPETLAASLREAVTRVDPNQAIANIRPITQNMSASLGPQRVTLVLVSVFAVAALALACLGIYGVMAYSIERRKRELSIRMALGALVSDILTMVMRDGARLGAIGVGVGVVAGLIGARLIQTQLYEVNARDPLVFAIAVGIIAVLLWGSVLIPAKRATNANPADVLRND